MGDGATLGFSNGATNYAGQSWFNTAGGFNADSAKTKASLGKESATDLSGIFSNWLTGGPKPQAIDPSVDIAQANKTRGASDQGAQGMGLGGLFGLGKINMFSPLQPGVPSTTPAMPHLGG